MKDLTWKKVCCILLSALLAAGACGCKSAVDPEKAKAMQEAQEAQKAALAAGYQGTNRQLYRDYMEHRRTLPQEMAAAGYSGGLSESSNIRLRNAYEEALANNERARISEEAGINNQYAQQAYEAQAAARAADLQARQNQYSYLTALEQQQYQQNQQELLNRANTMASVGDFSAYAALGYTQAEIDYLTKMWLAQNPTMKDSWIAAHPADARRLGLVTAAATAARGGGGGGGVYAPAVKTATADEANAAMRAAVATRASAAETAANINRENPVQQTVADLAIETIEEGGSPQTVQNEIMQLYGAGQISAREATRALEVTRAFSGNPIQ